jgi:hypothetical protein
MGFSFEIIYTNPFFIIGALLSFVAALAFLVFLRGFLSGIQNAFLQQSHAGHHREHRLRTIWGVLLLIVIFIVWEIVRWFAGLFS